jgi:hypothetical protein
MWPVLTYALNIFDFSIQIELKNEIRGFDLRIEAMADRKADLGKHPSSLLPQRGDEIIKSIRFHMIRKASF